ncbi:MAG: type II toxin-antitoxin system RelE/ParE family toxin [Chitinispirillia bacterium]|nr:type II toxin-antitoxin system RelE/ParE family toxin [Chitinispirillia bacterium]MCL2268645.1 type II toxin-antitoxin system RelE/ParE family toxin [Chitinispirillia bacterium]
MHGHNCRVVYADAAKKDLDSIRRNLFKWLLSRKIARNVVTKIKNTTDKQLSYMPQGYRLVDNDGLASLGYRRIIVKEYFIFFIVDEKAKIARVRRIIHGARDWLPIIQKDAESLEYNIK